MSKTEGKPDLNLDKITSMDVIREEICQSVETEIQNQVTEYEITDEEYIAISHAAWSKFYSCALQYHQAGLKPMGLVTDVGSGLVCIIKKSSFSFIRPVDALERLVLTTDDDLISPEIFHDTPILCEDPALSCDVINLMKAVSLVDMLSPPELLDDFSHSLMRLCSPDMISRKIARSILTSNNDNINFTEELSTRLQQVGDVAKALEVLLISLELDRGVVAHARSSSMDHGDDITDDAKAQFTSFSSQIGVSVLAESLNQVVKSRFELARNLLVLELLLLDCGGIMESSVMELVHTTFLPRTVVMSHCYFVLLWLTETMATAPPPNSL